VTSAKCSARASAPKIGAHFTVTCRFFANGIQLNGSSVSKRKLRMPTKLAECVVETTSGNHDGDFDDVRTELTQLYFEGIDNCVSELEA